MGVFEHFPYVNFHELNFSWMIAKIEELEDVIAHNIVDIVARAGVAANTQAINNLSTTVTNNATTAHNEALAAANAAAIADGKAVTADGKAVAAQNAADAAQTDVNSIGTRTTLISDSAATGANLAYTGLSFTLTKAAYVTAILYYNQSSPQEIAIADAASGQLRIFSHIGQESGVTNINIQTGALLPSGTYYIWAKSGSSGTNNVEVFSYKIKN